MEITDPTAATGYKAIIASARKAADDLRDWELARNEELDGAIRAAQAQLQAATEREQEIERSANRWWRMAADNVSRLSWLRAGDPPEPAPTAHGEHLDHHVDQIRPAYQELTQAVLSLGWRAR